MAQPAGHQAALQAKFGVQTGRAMWQQDSVAGGPPAAQEGVRLGALLLALRRGLLGGGLLGRVLRSHAQPFPTPAPCVHGRAGRERKFPATAGDAVSVHVPRCVQGCCEPSCQAQVSWQAVYTGVSAQVQQQKVASA